MAHVDTHLSIEDLAARYRACEDACAARHYQTIWLASGAGPYGPCGVGDDEFCAALDRGTAGALQCVGRNGARRFAAPQWDASFRSQARSTGKAQDPTAGAAAGWRGVVEPQGGGLHGSQARAGEARAAARLGGAQGDRLVDPVAAAEEPESGRAAGGSGF